MEKILIVGNIHLGDIINCTSILARGLKTSNNIIDGYFFNSCGYDLMKLTPFFDSVYMGYDVFKDIINKNYQKHIWEKNYLEIVPIFKDYQKIFIAGEGLRRAFNNCAKNIIVVKNPDITYYTPYFHADTYGFGRIDPFLNISWYARHYVNFNCNKKSVLLNCTSAQSHKTLDKQQVIKEKLLEYGYSVFELSNDTNICTNLHLINQCKYILCTDTSTLWLAKSLNKTPFVFLAGDISRSERELGVKNIISNYEHIWDIPYEEICSKFLYLTTKIKQ